MQSTIYLDNNATTAIDPAVAAAMADCYAAGYFNPASQHREGQRARQRLEQARDGIGRILNARLEHAPTDRILFTSGGTESNNLAIHGLRAKSFPRDQPGAQVIISSVEHPSVIEAARKTTSAGLVDAADSVIIAPVDTYGVLDVAAFKELLSPATRCVSVMLGNNETGVVQPVHEVVTACSALGIPVHTDAVQAVGKTPVSFSELGVAALTATAHKFHGPRGIGVLMLTADVELDPLMHGGSQQLGARPGTESVALAVGMHKALELWHADQEARQRHMARLRDQIQSDLTAAIPNLVVNGYAADNSPEISPKVARLPHTLNVSFPGIDRQALLLALDLAGVACSTGSACESGSSQPSHVLIAMNAPTEIVEGSIRISLSSRTSEDELQQATKIIIETAGRLAAL